MPGPQKQYPSYLPIVPCTIFQRQALHIIANARNITITDILREAWNLYCNLPENRKLLAAVDEAQAIAQAAPK